MFCLASEYWGIHVFAEICLPHAIQIRQTGGPEVLNWSAVDVGEPGSGQVRLRQAAAVLNYMLQTPTRHWKRAQRSTILTF
jgi:hypothetical protein